MVLRFLVFLFLFVLVNLGLSAQVRPDFFVEEITPNTDNFEVYSQKGGVNRRASLANLRKYFGAEIVTGSTPNLSGNGQSLRNKVVLVLPDSLAYFVDWKGDAVKLGGGINTGGGGAEVDTLYLNTTKDTLFLVVGLDVFFAVFDYASPTNVSDLRTELLDSLALDLDRDSTNELPAFFYLPSVADSASVSSPKRGDYIIPEDECQVRAIWTGFGWDVITGVVQTEVNVVASGYYGTGSAYNVQRTESIVIEELATDSVALRSLIVNETELIPGKLLYVQDACSLVRLDTLITNNTAAAVSLYNNNSDCSVAAFMSHTFDITFNTLSYATDSSNVQRSAVSFAQKTQTSDVYFFKFASLLNIDSITTDNASFLLSQNADTLFVEVLPTTSNVGGNLIFDFCNLQTSQFRIRFDTLLNTISFVASAFTETGVENRVAKYVGQRTFAPSGIIDNNNRTVFDRPINLPNFNASPIVGDIWRNSAGTYLQYRNAAGVSRELSPRFWSESGDEISRVGRINVDVLSGSAFRFSLGNNSSNKYLTFYEDSSVTTNTGVLQFEYNSSISANVIRLSESGRYFDIISTADAKRLEIRNSISNYADSYFYPNVRTAVRPGLFMRRFDTSSGLETTFNTYTSMEGISVIYTTGGNTSSGDVHISTRNSSAISGDNNFQKRVTFDHQGNTILHTPTGVLKINVGTTAQAPATKQFGQLRGNSTTGRYTAVASDNTTVNNITTDNVLSDSLQRQRTYALVSQTGVDTTAADALQAINKLSLNAASRNFTITGDSAFVVAVAGVYRIDGKCRSAAPGAIGDYVHTFEVHVNNVAVNSTILSVTTNAGGQQFPSAGFATLAASDIVKFKIAAGFEQIITTQQCSFIVELLKPN